jgi:hypothetical protein
MANRRSDAVKVVALLFSCAHRAEDTEAGWSEVDSVDPAEARNSSCH